MGGLGGFLAAAAAVVAWRVNKRMLLVEEARDAKLTGREREAQERRRREQAALVFALGAKLPQRGSDETWAIYLFNGSDKPVYNVRVESQRLSGGVANHALELGAVPPGRFVVPSHPTYHWGSLIDLSLLPEPVDLLVKGKGKGMITQVGFVDADGASWVLRSGTELAEGAGDSGARAPGHALEPRT
ncbi:hypothetical protein D3228_13315 [Leucobacter luti]|nr:hypothetical protein [Leucobacter luti]